MRGKVLQAKIVKNHKDPEKWLSVIQIPIE